MIILKLEVVSGPFQKAELRRPSEINQLILLREKECLIIVIWSEILIKRRDRDMEDLIREAEVSERSTQSEVHHIVYQRR